MDNKIYPINYGFSLNTLLSDEEFKKDCPDYDNIPIIMPKADRIIAIGDIHGDYELAIQSFKLAKLINDNLEWVANPPNTIVVQVGDQIDNCRIYDCQEKKYPYDENSDIKILKFFYDMHQKAKLKGGMVISLLGNHEIKNSQGEFEYVSYENYHNFEYEHNGNIYKGPKGRFKAFEPGGPLAKYMACTRVSSVIIGSNLFVHAGILPVLINKLDELKISTHAKYQYINNVIRKWLLNNLETVPRDKKPNNIFMDQLLSDSKLSPFWPRVFGNIQPDKPHTNLACQTYLEPILDVFKIGKLIVGHTPQLYKNGLGINSTCSEKLYRVDGGFSNAFKIFGTSNMIQVLEIINDNEVNILTTRRHH
jgi:hypothetical protein